MKTHTAFTRSGPATGGFTLVEVLIGIVIFAFMATALFRTIDQGFRIMESARDFTRVTQILQYQTETLRGSSWSSLSDMAGTMAVNVDAHGTPMATKAAVPYSWQSFNMTQTITEEKPDLIRATLTATWTNRKGNQKTRSYETLITKDGLNAFYIRTAS